MNQNSYTLIYKECPTPAEEEILIQGIIQAAIEAKKQDPIHPFSFFIRDSKETILGGIKGATFYGSLYIDSLWISSSLRNQGWGSKLVRAAEHLAKKRNCRFATVSTMDWEALPFYQKLGYEIEFTREGYNENSKMFLLIKKL